MSSGFNGLPNIKMEDGGMGSLGLKVKHKTFNISVWDQSSPALLTVMSLLRLTLCDATSGHQVNPIYQFNPSPVPTSNLPLAPELSGVPTLKE